MRFSAALTCVSFFSSIFLSPEVPFLVVLAPLGRDGILSGIQGISSQFSFCYPFLYPLRRSRLLFDDRRSEKFLSETDFVGFEIEGSVLSHLMDKGQPNMYDMKRNLILINNF